MTPEHLTARIAVMRHRETDHAKSAAFYAGTLVANMAVSAEVVITRTVPLGLFAPVAAFTLGVGAYKGVQEALASQSAASTAALLEAVLPDAAG